MTTDLIMRVIVRTTSRQIKRIVKCRHHMVHDGFQPSWPIEAGVPGRKRESLSWRNSMRTDEHKKLNSGNAEPYAFLFFLFFILSSGGWGKIKL